MELLQVAHKISDAAACIDYLKQSPHISDSCRAEAVQMVESLHDIAQLLAGDQNLQVYSPNDEPQFLPEREYFTEVNFGKTKHFPFKLSHYRASNGIMFVGVQVVAHPFALDIWPTPAQCRELAMALKQLADDAEASASQHIQPSIELEDAARQCTCEASNA